MEVTLNLPENIYRNFSAIAEKNHRRVEEVIADKLQVDESAETKEIEKILRLNVDEGEASAMALYLEQTDDALLIIDERKGRIITRDLGIKILGTIGILIKAEQTGIIANLTETIEKLKQTDFRLSPKLKKQLLDKNT